MNWRVPLLLAYSNGRIEAWRPNADGLGSTLVDIFYSPEAARAWLNKESK